MPWRDAIQTLSNKTILNSVLKNVIIDGRQFQAKVKTSISTAGAGVLTAAGMVGGYILRTGPSGAYTDTTDTATALVAAIPGCKVGTTFELTILNGVAYVCTVAAGTGVTLTGTTAIAASVWRNYLGTVTALGDTPTVTLLGLGSGIA